MKKEAIIIVAIAMIFGIWGLAMTADMHDQVMLKKCHLSQQERERVVLWMSGGK